MVFAFLFGLSMDYEVFILSRIREEYDGGASTDEAVVLGIGRTGRLVTSAALILFLAFAALASGPGTDIKVMATALGLRHPARRDPGPVGAGAVAGLVVRLLELVPARPRRADPAHPAVRRPSRAPGAGPRRRLSGCLRHRCMP